MLPFLLPINICMKDSFVLITLIDITETKIIRGESKERDQQRNWESVLQVLGLLTQPIILEGPITISNINLIENSAIDNWFGDFYRSFDGPHSLWAVKFTSEKEDIYSLDQLYKDFDQVPIILGLEETAKFMLPIFHSYGALKNIHFSPANELNN